ncbi:MAG: glycerol-3-phosphate acyltransferase [Myxococcota bacterium]
MTLSALLGGGLFLLLSYLGAAIPFGVVVTTLYGGDADIRTTGSGNIGGTNVARVYGWRLAALVITLDAAKGFVPVALARLWWPGAGIGWWAAVLAACFLGHCFPVYLEFRGGKGVATSAGGLLAMAPRVAVLAGALWLVLLAATGRSSVAALGATAGAIGVALWLDPWVAPVVVGIGLAVMATHVPNIRRLVRGEEGSVVRPVRWGRASALPPEPGVLLQQGPTGGPPVAAFLDR